MPNPANKLFSYLREAKQELGKVTWPTRKDTYRYSLLVICICLAVGIFFFVLDTFFSRGLSVLINL
jgi:preprotein translocase subunit SecE